MSIERSQWPQATPHDAAPPATLHPAAGRPLVVAGGEAGVPAALAAAARRMPVRLEALPAAAGPIPAAAFQADLLWVALDSEPDPAAMEALAEAVSAHYLPLVLHVSGAAIDPVWAVFGDRPGNAILIDPDEADCIATLGQMLRRADSRVASPTAEAQDRQLEALQQEVARIARLLARLEPAAMPPAGFGGTGAPSPFAVPPSPFIDDHLRSPPRTWASETPARGQGTPVSARDVRRMIRQRRMRDELFAAELFADPAWDMLLDLYAARLEGMRVSVSSLCIAAAVPATTALRWVKTMTDTGLFVRQEDPLDKRRIFVALSDHATVAMHRYFERIAAE